MLTYTREDGVSLSGELYLPANYEELRRKEGPLPCLLWAYPREFKDPKAAGQLRDSPYRYFVLDWKGPMFMLARGWAVLDGPAFVGLGREFRLSSARSTAFGGRDVARSIFLWD